MAARLALERILPHAVFVGERHGHQLARLFASLDVFVHTGPLETFCQAVQEALASGLPVVAPAAGGPLDLVEPSRTGFLVPPGDGNAIADAVNVLVNRPDLRQRYGRAARDAVAGRTWSAVGDELIAHYLAVVGVAALESEVAACPMPPIRPDERAYSAISDVH